MIDWVHQEEGYCEGHFKSTFFRDDEKKDIFTVMSSNPDSNEYAEKCVEAFNNLTETIIYEICQEIIHHVKEEETYEGIELSSLDNTQVRAIDYAIQSIERLNQISSIINKR